MKRDLVLILGPTAVGKTSVAMALQDLIGGVQAAQLISVDSAMVYRGMNIGTAKPTDEELRAYPHDLINLLEPNQTYTAADFVADADAAVVAAWRRGQLPILVGGSMLYAKRFIEGMAKLPQSDVLVRTAIEAELAKCGAQSLHDELAAFDPEAASNIHPNNPQRLVRALEVVRTTGQPLTQLWREQAGGSVVERIRARAKIFSIEPDDRKMLHEKIAQRFDVMMQNGFEAELRQLARRGDLHAQMPSMRCVGYRQGLQYLAGEVSYETFATDTVTATRRLAKRQLTWLRNWPAIVRLNWGQNEATARQIEQQLG